MSRDFSSMSRSEREPERRDRERLPVTPRPDRPLSREQVTVRERGCLYQVSAAERALLSEVGRFRTVAVPDLLAHRYQGKAKPFEEDLRHLLEQGLLARRTVWTAGKGRSLTVAVLTKRGKGLLDGQRQEAAGQRFYSGLVKPAEVHHDAAIYRMFQAESQKILAAGGQLERVVLDYELKEKIYRPLAKARPRLSKLAYARLQEEVARQNGLKVVQGRVLLPDLRIEYHTRDGQQASVDLELATHHYRGRAMRGKAEAGFKMYAPAESAAGLAAAFDPEFAAQIFSL